MGEEVKDDDLEAVDPQLFHELQTIAGRPLQGTENARGGPLHMSIEVSLPAACARRCPCDSDPPFLFAIKVENPDPSLSDRPIVIDLRDASASFQGMCACFPLLSFAFPDTRPSLSLSLSLRNP